MSFNSSLNDKAIRLAQLNEAYTAVSKSRTIEPGPVFNSLQNEIEALSKMIANDVAMFRANGNRWP